MEDSKTYVKNKVGGTFLTVLVGALLMGMLWRFRGEQGWGSSWGLLAAGFIFTMFLVSVTGERKKLDLGWLGVTAVSFMLTVPSWGTLLYQITGVLYYKEFWAHGDEYCTVSVFSAVFLMLCLGFGLASVYGVMLGRAYSGKAWKIRDFIILLAVFYAADLISKATLSHWVLNLVQPQAAEMFEKGLQNAGITESVYSSYMHHFDDLSWAKKLDGGRNYFSSIQAISSVFRGAAVLVAVRFIVKDRISAKVGLQVSCAFAFAITVADLFFYFGDGGYHMNGTSPLPAWADVWGLWEYFTGFLAGGIITACILRLKTQPDVSEEAFAKVPLNIKRVLTFLLFYVFVFALNFVRPVLERFKDTDYQIIATAVAGVCALALCVILIAKNGLLAEKSGVCRFTLAAVPAFTVYWCIVYLFVGSKECADKLGSPIATTWLVIISAASVIAYYTVLLIKGKKEKSA